MTIDEQVEKRVYNRLRAYDGVEVAGHAPVNSSIASVLSEGEVLADNGEQYSSIQQAVDVSDGFVFVGPGTFNENVVIDKDGFTLQGAGRDTLIDGGTVDHAIKVVSDNVSVTNISVKTTPGAGNSYNGVEIDNASNVNISSVIVRDSDNNGIAPEGQDITISNCTIEGCDSIAIRPRADRCLVTNCSVLSSSNQGINISDASGTGDDVIISNCTVKNTSGTGIFVDGDDCIVIGCRIMNAGNDGINISKNDCIIANNRVSDSTNIDIDNNGTGTVTDGNLTGSAN